jgi:putative ABC transport system substrate-binding protein
MAYAADIADQHRRAATYVDRLLRGAKVSDLPVQFPAKFKLVINLKTAKAIGLTIPRGVPAARRRVDRMRRRQQKLARSAGASPAQVRS